MASLAARRRAVWDKKWFGDLARNYCGIKRKPTWPAQRDGSLPLAECERLRDWLVWKLGGEHGDRPPFPAKVADFADGLAWEVLDEKRAQGKPGQLPPPVPGGPVPGDIVAPDPKYPLFQGLGAFVATVGNLSDRSLDMFRDIGGDWLVPVMIGDGASGPANTAAIPDLRRRCADRRIALGGWHNYWGEDPVAWAQQVAAFTLSHDLKLVVLDCESSVQFSTLMARLAREIRRLLPDHHIAVSTNSLNDSVVYNGRTEEQADHPELWRSFWDQRIYVLPQWYNSPRYGRRDNKWTTPDLNTRWLLDHGMQDNLHDPNAPGGRAVPLELVKGTLETTGLEDADLEGELTDMEAARLLGLGLGCSLYLLENAPDRDLTLMGQHRGRLYAA